MKQIALLLGACLAVFVSPCQVKELTLGDQMVTSSPLGKLLAGEGSISLAQYKGKAVILDFWNVNCTACLKAFPKMDSLQQRYSDKLQIIAVTKNTRQQVNDLFGRIKIKRPNFPFIVEDERLHKAFPHQSQPHHVWLDSAAFVRYITHGYNATEQHVSELINGQKLSMSFKKLIKDFDDKAPLIKEAATRLSPYTKYYSLLLSGIHDTVRSFRIQVDVDSTTGHPYAIKAINAKILTLFSIAYNKEVYGFDVWAANLSVNRRLLLEVAHPQAFALPENGNEHDAWRTANTFSYEIKVPPVNDNACYRYMQADLNRYFNYTAAIEKRRTRYLALIKADATKTGCLAPSGTPYHMPGLTSFTIRNTPFSFFLAAFLYANQSQPLPVVDETGIIGPVNLTVNAALSDIDTLRKELLKYGLGIEEKTGNINMLVVKDKLLEK